MPEEKLYNGQTNAQETIGIETRGSDKKRALVEFRQRVEDAINGSYIMKCNKKEINLKEITLWGIPLLPSANHEGTDIVLSKFLRAKNYKVHEAFTMLRKTLKWRSEFLPEGDVMSRRDENASGKLWFCDGRDKEGRPLCYMMVGTKYNEEYLMGGKGQDYLRWRFDCLERGVKCLEFKEGGADSIIQIIDLENAPGPATKEVRLTYKKFITMLHDHYPGLVHKILIINVPSWFYTIHALNMRLITQKSKNKFIFVKSSKVTQTLLKYATPENILVQYGGLKRENDIEFTTDDKVLEINLTNTITNIEIPVNEAEVTVTWDVAVVGSEVTYKEEFIPEDDCSYKILLRKEKKMGEGIRNSFPIREPGKIVITIVNGSFTKKKVVFYRYKSRPSVPLYMFYKS